MGNESSRQAEGISMDNGGGLKRQMSNPIEENKDNSLTDSRKGSN